jgi:hypothetical protein
MEAVEQQRQRHQKILKNAAEPVEAAGDDLPASGRDEST